MRISLVIGLLFLFLFCSGQEVTFERITTKDGLSQNDIMEIYQDHLGYIWFGTNDGLNRYDGYEFKTYKVGQDSENSISSNLISEILEDSEDNLWVGTLNSGISIFDQSTETFNNLKNSPESPNILSGNFIYELVLLADGSVWAGTLTGMNFITKDSTNQFSVDKFTDKADSPLELPQLMHNVFVEIDSVNAIIGTNSMFYLLKRTSPDPTEWELIDIFQNDEINNVLRIIPYDDGYLIGHNLGIHFLRINVDNPENYTLTRITTNTALEMAIDLNGNLWSGSSSGLYLYKPSGNPQKPFKLHNHFIEGSNSNNISNIFIRSLLVDRSGILWIGTNGGGVCKYNPMKQKFRHYKRGSQSGSISMNKVTEIYEDSEYNIWFGTEGGGLNLLPSEEAKVKNYQTGFKHFDVNLPNQQNFLYDFLDISTPQRKEFLGGIGFESKLIKVVEESKGNWKIEPGPIPVDLASFTLCKTSDGAIWIGNYDGGLYKYFPDSQNGEFFHYTIENSSLPSNIIRSLLEDSQGRLWIGTGEGLCWLSPEEKVSAKPHFKIFKNISTNPLSLSQDYILPLFETSRGAIWIGTLGGGLNKYVEGSESNDGIFYRLNTSNGMPNDVIKAIVEDHDGNLWISSNKGITKYNETTGDLRNYDVADGLQDTEFADISACVLHDGEILFGGVNGFNAFYPDEISTDSTPPVVIFTKLEIFNEHIMVDQELNGKVILSTDINETSSIRLGYKENNFTLHFAAIHYSAPYSNQYKYRLKGYNNEWLRPKSSARFAKYTNLKEGEYVFEVLASNSDGIWVSEPKSLTIYIRPPYWQTWWFRLGAIMLIFGFSILYVFVRYRYIRKENIMLELKVTERTKKIRAQNDLLASQKQQLNTLNQELFSQTEILNETNTQLEERQQLIEEQAEELNTQKEILLEANATKDKFYSILAHDLKNPFNTLLGYTEILKMKYSKFDEEKRLTFITYIHESAQLLYKMMQNLLQWSRSQQGLMPFHPEELDIKKLVGEELAIQKNSATVKKINTILSNNCLQNIIYADDNMLRTVFRNILSNAIKFTHEEGRVDITIQEKEENILFTIKDTGVGLSDDVRKNIFRIDHHHTSEGTANERGTGLGLIICKEFIENHKGKIWVESEVDKGTTFSFTIPNTKEN